MSLLSIIIPVYNEANTINKILKKIINTELIDNIKKEIILVNDCSNDNSESIIEDLIIDNPGENIKIFNHQVNQGKGAALKTGIQNASGDFIIIQDADLEYDPNEYNLLLKPVINGFADVVYGSRFMGGKPHRILFFWHSIGNKFLTSLLNMFTNLNLTDMNTCYKLFRSDILKNIPLHEKRFGFDPEVTAKVAKIPHVRIYEVGISYYGRTYADGKKIGWRDGFRSIYCTLRYSLFNTTSFKKFLSEKLARKPFVIGFFCIFSLFLIYLINKENNLGVNPDSTVYIIGAENIKQGKGFVDNNGVLINHFPPMYSLTLAILSNIFKTDILAVGVFANAIFITLFILIINLILLKAKFSLAGIVVFNLFILSSNFISVFNWCLTEGMFIFELTLIFYLILQIHDREKKLAKLILAGILSGILILTRYAGFPFVAIAFLYILISSAGINKIKNSMSFLIPLILVLGIWIFYSTLHNMPATNRKMIFHPITMRQINKLISTTYSWLSPFGVKTSLVIYFAILMINVWYGSINKFAFEFKKGFLNGTRVLIFSVVTCVFYIAFLFFSISFFDAGTTLNKRILAPIFPFFLLSCAFYVRYFISNHNRFAGVIFRGIVSLLLIGFSYNKIKEEISIKKYGQGYTSRQWRDSDMTKQINNYNGYKIYTNAVDVIAFASKSKIASYSLPAKYNFVELVANKNFNQDINDLKEIISNGNSVIMYFNMKKRKYLVDDQDLKEIFKDGFLQIQLNDGIIIKGDK